MRGTATRPFVYHHTDASNVKSPNRVGQSVPKYDAYSRIENSAEAT